VQGEEVIQFVTQTSDGVIGVVRTAAGAETLNDQLRGVASFAVLTLAVLTFFTTRRAQQLSEDSNAGLGSLGLGTIGNAFLDLLLALTTFFACAAMFSLFTASWSVSQWADRDHVSQSMFSIVYIGFAAVLIVQLGLVAGRVIPSLNNTLDQRRSRSSSG
jgi:hypothetical protein